MTRLFLTATKNAVWLARAKALIFVLFSPVSPRLPPARPNPGNQKSCPFFLKKNQGSAYSLRHHRLRLGLCP